MLFSDEIRLLEEFHLYSKTSSSKTKYTPSLYGLLFDVSEPFSLSLSLLAIIFFLLFFSTVSLSALGDLPTETGFRLCCSIRPFHSSFSSTSVLFVLLSRHATSRLREPYDLSLGISGALGLDLSDDPDLYRNRPLSTSFHIRRYDNLSSSISTSSEKSGVLNSDGIFAIHHVDSFLYRLCTSTQGLNLFLFFSLILCVRTFSLPDSMYLYSSFG